MECDRIIAMAPDMFKKRLMGHHYDMGWRYCSLCAYGARTDIKNCFCCGARLRCTVTNPNGHYRRLPLEERIKYIIAQRICRKCGSNETYENKIRGVKYWYETRNIKGPLCRKCYDTPRRRLKQQRVITVFNSSS